MGVDGDDQYAFFQGKNKIISAYFSFFLAYSLSESISFLPSELSK